MHLRYLFIRIQYLFYPEYLISCGQSLNSDLRHPQKNQVIKSPQKTVLNMESTFQNYGKEYSLEREFICKV